MDDPLDYSEVFHWHSRKESFELSDPRAQKKKKPGPCRSPDEFRGGSLAPFLPEPRPDRGERAGADPLAAGLRTLRRDAADLARRVPVRFGLDRHRHESHAAALRSFFLHSWFVVTSILFSFS